MYISVVLKGEKEKGRGADGVGEGENSLRASACIDLCFVGQPLAASLFYPPGLPQVSFLYVSHCAFSYFLHFFLD